METVLTQNLSISPTAFRSMFRTFALLTCLLPLSAGAEQYLCTSVSSVDSSVTTRTFKRTKTGFNATFVSTFKDSEGRVYSDVQEEVFDGYEDEVFSKHVIENQSSILLIKHLFSAADVYIINKSAMEITSSSVHAAEPAYLRLIQGKSLNGEYDVGFCHLND